MKGTEIFQERPMPEVLLRYPVLFGALILSILLLSFALMVSGLGIFSLIGITNFYFIYRSVLKYINSKREFERNMKITAEK